MLNLVRSSKPAVNGRILTSAVGLSIHQLSFIGSACFAKNKNEREGHGYQDWLVDMRIQHVDPPQESVIYTVGIPESRIAGFYLLDPPRGPG